MKLKQIPFHLLLLIASVTVFLVLLEIALGLGLFKRVVPEHPVRNSTEFMELNLAINEENRALARQNCWGFTDTDHPIEKPSDITRIMVIGDSFVWGDGLPHQLTWGHVLKMILEEAGYEDIEVLSCGRCGWSSLHQIEWLEEYGYRYGTDLLLVSWTSNDPELGSMPAPRSFNCRRWPALAPVKAVFPRSFELLTDLVNSLVNKSRRWTFDDYLELVYSPDNLIRYRKYVLERFRKFADQHGIRLLFVMVPRDWTDRYAETIGRVTPLLDQCNIEYLNLHPAVRERLGHVPVRKLQSNPVNPHPGEVLHRVYADEVFKHIKERINPANKPTSHIRRFGSL